MQEEIFKDINGYEGKYQISNFSNVKALGNNKARKEKILTHKKNINGYLFVILYKNNKPRTFGIHQLMAMAFLEHIPCGKNIVVDHINNIKTDNRVENLQLISVRENSSKDKKGYSSKYVGVHFDKKSNKWRARIHINGKKIHLGSYTDELKANEAYQNKLKILTPKQITK